MQRVTNKVVLDAQRAETAAVAREDITAYRYETAARYYNRRAEELGLPHVKAKHASGWRIIRELAKLNRIEATDVEQQLEALHKLLDRQTAPMRGKQDHEQLARFYNARAKHMGAHSFDIALTHGTRLIRLLAIANGCEAANDLNEQLRYLANLLGTSPDPEQPEFLLSYEWKRVRMDAFKTYGNRCQCCGAGPDTAHLQVDHVLPRKTHPHLALDVGNLQILCSDCNHGKAERQWDWRPTKEQAPTKGAAHAAPAQAQDSPHHRTAQG